MATKERLITKFAPSPRPISSPMILRTIVSYSASSVSKPASASSKGRSGTVASVSSTLSLVCSTTVMASSGVPSSWCA